MQQKYNHVAIKFLSEETQLLLARNECKTILVDFDGTLVDYHHSESLALRTILLEKGLNDDRINEAIVAYRKINESLWKQFEKDELGIEEVKIERFRRLTNLFSLDIEPTQFNDRYLDLFVKYVKPYPKAVQALEKLYKTGLYNIIIVTNGTDPVQRKRASLTRIDQFIHGLFSSDGVGFSKPSRQIFDISLESVNGSYEQSWMIGDSLSSDITGAYQLGIKTCLIDNHARNEDPKPKPDMVVPSFVEFVDWMTG